MSKRTPPATATHATSQGRPRACVTFRNTKYTTLALTLGVLVTGLLITFYRVSLLRAGSLAAEQDRFGRMAERVKHETLRRLNEHAIVLEGARGLFAASDSVKRSEFRAYFASQKTLHRFNGAYGVGFIERVPRKDLWLFTSAERGDEAPEFTVKTSGGLPEMYVVKFIEPLDSNLPDVGVDINPDPVRRSAAEQAMLTGEAALSGKATLLQDKQQNAGFVYMLPIYRGGVVPAAAAQRRLELVGWVYAPLVIHETLAGVTESAEGRVSLEVYDDTEGRGATPLYRDDGVARTTGAASAVSREPLFRETTTVAVGGRTWTLLLSSTPVSEAEVNRSTPSLVGFGGAAISLLLAVVVWGMGTSRARAVRLAEGMVVDLALARDQALAADRAKNQFLANMSHEIRTPLTSILGFADILREDPYLAAAPGDQLQNVATISGAGRHLLGVIDRILDFSKIESDTVNVEHSEVALVGFLTEIEAIMRPKAEYKGLAFSARLETPLPDRIVSEPTYLRQIILNLADNAIKFTSAGSVVIRALAAESEKGPRLHIEVEDTGTGIVPGQVGAIFDPFTQVDSGMTREYGGTGLGLTICRRLTTIMGGTVTLERSEEGKGSLFRVDLPLQAAPGAQMVNSLTPAPRAPIVEAAAPSVMPGPVRLEGRVLLAEDGLDNQRLIALHLRKAGAETDIADNGRIALEMLESADREGRPYALLVSDMQMPEMDGYTLATTLRKRGSTVAIVALTAHAMAGDRQKCLAAGCDAYATKPINKARLLEVCSTWLGRSSTAKLVAATA